MGIIAVVCPDCGKLGMVQGKPGDPQLKRLPCEECYRAANQTTHQPVGEKEEGDGG